MKPFNFPVLLLLTSFFAPNLSSAEGGDDQSLQEELLQSEGIKNGECCSYSQYGRKDYFKIVDGRCIVASCMRYPLCKPEGGKWWVRAGILAACQDGRYAPWPELSK